MKKFTILDNVPVMILGSYRSGSTALGSFLAKKLNSKYFEEPYHWNDDIRAKWSDFFKYKKDNKNYVWKLFPDHIPLVDSEREECFQTWSSSYVIKLLRKNIAKQITSWIISMKTDVWNDTKVIQIPTVDIDDDFIKYCVHKQLLNLDYLDGIKENSYSVQLYYEDILNLLNKSDFKPTAKPENYNEVLSKVTDILKQQGRV
jgi:hypothetical protein